MKDVLNYKQENTKVYSTLELLNCEKTKTLLYTYTTKSNEIIKVWSDMYAIIMHSSIRYQNHKVH